MPYTSTASIYIRKTQHIRHNSLSFLSIIYLLFLCGIILACSGCGTETPPQPSLQAEDPALVIWPRAEGAIQLHCSATKDLNIYNSRPHSLQVCIYQLSNGESFLNLARTQEGISKLLEAQPFDDKVKDIIRIFLQPLETTTVILDRAEGATYVGIVSGFFKSTPAQSAGLIQIMPSVENTGVIVNTPIYSAGILDVSLRFSAYNMDTYTPALNEDDKNTKKTSNATPPPPIMQRPNVQAGTGIPVPTSTMQPTTTSAPASETATPTETEETTSTETEETTPTETEEIVPTTEATASTETEEVAPATEATAPTETEEIAPATEATAPESTTKTATPVE